MEKIKLLLYCTKQKPYLVSYNNTNEHWYLLRENEKKPFPQLNSYNGKIAVECDFEVEKYKVEEAYGNEMRVRCKVLYGNVGQYSGNDEMLKNILKGSCLTNQELTKYMAFKDMWSTPMYAIHIKNLHIFDKAREVNEYLGAIKKDSVFYPLQNCSSMMRVYQRKDLNNIDYNNFDWELLDKTNIEDVNKYIVISVSSQEMCRICNGEQTILIRKRVLKEML